MKNHRWMSILAALLLPLPALAAEIPENVVVPLPTAVPPPELVFTDSQSAYGFEDLGIYLADEPVGLSEEEASRLPSVLARFRLGERPAKSVLNCTEDVVLGVYSLPAEAYEGERVFTLLPSRALTDEELLQLVEAFDALGETFDPAGLTWRNCMRGGSIESTRAYTPEERERADRLSDLYKREMIDAPEAAFTPLPGDDGIGEIRLYAEQYSGLTGFRFRPARRLTDEELLREAVHALDKQPVSSAMYSQYEAIVRRELYRRMGLPLSAKRGSERISSESPFIWGPERMLYCVDFETGFPTDAFCYAYLDVQTLHLVYATLHGPIGGMYSDLHCNPFAEKWLEIASDWVRTHLTEEEDIETVESMGEIAIQDIGYGAAVRVTLTDGSAYELTLPFSSETVFIADYSDAEEMRQKTAYWANSLGGVHK